MDLTLISVNYRSEDHLQKMIASAQRHLPKDRVEIIVVNHDEGESLSFGKDVQVLTESNLGFAAGCNLGISKSKGRYLALINPDVIFTNDDLLKMISYLDEDRDVGIAGGRLRYPDGRHQDSVRRFPAPIDQFLVLLKLPHLFPTMIERYLAKDLDYTKTQDVDQVMGAFFVIRREAYESIGTMDEGFFYWFEEVDYCRRARNAGWNVRYYADVVAEHTGGGSFRRVETVKKQRVIRRSIRRYMWKHFGWKGWLPFVLFHPVFWILGYVVALKKPR